jgi:hypothetical protein
MIYQCRAERELKQETGFFPRRSLIVKRERSPLSKQIDLYK